ncbi:MAG: FAD-dependent oxidoreductase [Phycisphaeraceae bacterium]|nr:FAD-dependent oxidoreductase [Phycisphaeraceae bacterium]
MNQPESLERYDVPVVGGGPAGVVAATQAAAAGANTLLVEASGMLGGTTTRAGINFPGLFHAWGRQVIAGYGWQLVTDCVDLCGDELPDFTKVPDRHFHHQVKVSRPVYTCLCDEMVTGAGADVLFFAMPQAVTPTDTGWRVTLATKTGPVEREAAVVIDATGDANVVELAGGAIRRHEQEHQPGTQSCVMSGYDMAELDLPAINAALREAVDRGEVRVHDVGWNTRDVDIRRWLSCGGRNANHIPGIDGRTSAGRTQMQLAGRAAIMRLFRFLKQQPGLENLCIDELPPECGVRETATIVGDKTITAEDYTTGRVWDEAVCYSFYPIDLHVSDDAGLDCRPLEAPRVPTVPRGALLPAGLSRIAVAGRCVSSDRLANSALRVQASAMAMGQAAGAMASLAAEGGTDLREVAIDTVRARLADHGAVVPEKVDG